MSHWRSQSALAFDHFEAVAVFANASFSEGRGLRNMLFDLESKRAPRKAFRITIGVGSRLAAIYRPLTAPVQTRLIAWVFCQDPGSFEEAGRSHAYYQVKTVTIRVVTNLTFGECDSATNILGQLKIQPVPGHGAVNGSILRRVSPGHMTPSLLHRESEPSGSGSGQQVPFPGEYAPLLQAKKRLASDDDDGAALTGKASRLIST
jgi:hypothetical protein